MATESYIVSEEEELSDMRPRISNGTNVSEVTQLKADIENFTTRVSELDADRITSGGGDWITSQRY